MKNNSGFTLMELMVVIAIVGILSAIALPNFMSWRQNQQYTSALRRAVSVMHSAKANAVKENVPAVVVFDAGAQTIRAFVDRNFNNAWDAATDRLIDFYEMPTGVQITHSAFAGGVNWVRFNGRGMPNGFGGRVELTSDKGLSHAVRVNITGRIQLTPP